jgi:putative transposase
LTLSNNILKFKEVNKSYKYRIYPSFEQEKYLIQSIGGSRFVFNQLKGLQEFLYKNYCYGNSIPEGYNFNPFSKYITQNYNTKLKKVFLWLNDIDSHNTMRTAHSFTQSMLNFKKSGFGMPKYKSRHNPVQSFTTTYIKVIDGKLKIPKLKETIKMKYSRPIKGKILSGTISKENNKWYVSINVSKSIITSKPKTGKIVGIDLGLKDAITCSNGKKSGKIQLKFFDNKIKILGKKIANRIKDSCNWSKTKVKLAQTYINKKNYIKDFIHKITTKIVNNNDQIYVGNVNNQLGLKNKKLAKTTADQHWYEIKRQLEYKSDWYDKKFKVVNEKYTSKTCSNCGYKLLELGLGVRTWTCPECNSKHDRDINAAINIQTVGTTGFAFSKTNIKLVD